MYRNRSKLLIGLYQAHRYGNLNMEYKIKKTHHGISRFFYFVGSKKARTKSQNYKLHHLEQHRKHRFDEIEFQHRFR
jgi:hypothetical protein